MTRCGTTILLLLLAALAGCKSAPWMSSEEAESQTPVQDRPMDAEASGIESDSMPGYFPRAILDEAVALTAKGQYDEAEALLTPAIEANDCGQDGEGLGQAIFWRGYCREQTGRIGAASLDYEDVITRFPETPAAAHAANRLSLLTP